ncbi:MAG: hypothetical protein Q4B05_03915 [Candidatus Saccharibacteria bacterium]|nr:hypothetical protein [Candidatus Saccharibacteria bacterium]
MLTKKQKILLDTIGAFIKEHGYSPTLRELMRLLRYQSVSTVAKHIDNLVAAGYLYKQEGAVRSLSLTTPAQAAQPWRLAIEQAITRREASGTAEALEQAVVLRQALAILSGD